MKMDYYFEKNLKKYYNSLTFSEILFASKLLDFDPWWMLVELTRTWFHATDSDGVWLAVQTQADGVVPGVAQSLSLLGPISTWHWTLQIRKKKNDSYFLKVQK